MNFKNCILFLILLAFAYPVALIAEGPKAPVESEVKEETEAKTLEGVKVDFDVLKKWGKKRYIIKVKGGPARALMEVGEVILENIIQKDMAIFKMSMKMKMEEGTMTIKAKMTSLTECAKDDLLTARKSEFQGTMSTEGPEGAGGPQGDQITAAEMLVEGDKVKINKKKGGKEEKEEIDFEKGAYFGLTYLRIIPFLSKDNGAKYKLIVTDPMQADSGMFEEKILTCQGLEKTEGLDCIKYTLGSGFSKTELWFSKEGHMIKYKEGDNMEMVLDQKEAKKDSKEEKDEK
jgi:hypothetical protein